MERLNLKRLVAEGSVIVASILLAFAVDAWWTSRQESDEANELLTDFKGELSENIRIVERELLFRRAKEVSARRLLELAVKPDAVLCSIYRRANN